MSLWVCDFGLWTLVWGLVHGFTKFRVFTSSLIVASQFSFKFRFGIRLIREITCGANHGFYEFKMIYDRIWMKKIRLLTWEIFPTWHGNKLAVTDYPIQHSLVYHSRAKFGKCWCIFLFLGRGYWNNDSCWHGGRRCQKSPKKCWLTLWTVPYHIGRLIQRLKNVGLKIFQSNIFEVIGLP